MDHFEQQLARMMRNAEERASFEPTHRERLRAGVRARRRVRIAQRAVGSALAVAGLGVGLFLLPGGPTRAEPSDPRPRPATSPSPPAPDTAPDVSPTAPSSSSATSSVPASPDRTATTLPPVTTGSSVTSSDTASETPHGSTAATAPPSTSAPPSATETARNEPSTDQSSLIAP